MVNQQFQGGLNGLVRSVVIGGIALLGTVDTGLAAGNDDPVECDFTASLSQPDRRARYQSQRSALQEAALSHAVRLELYGSVETASSADGQETPIDWVSRDCLICHNGNGGKRIDTAHKGGPGGHTGEMAKISARHPIGTDYAKASSSRDTMRKMGELPSSMVLVDGRISCITCHDPLNRERFHLAEKVSESTLCFTCHLM